MNGNLLPFLMLGILTAAILAKPLSKQKLISMPAGDLYPSILHLWF